MTTKRLRNIYRPYFLRREKKDVFKSSDTPSQTKDTKPADEEGKGSPTTLCAKKFDLIVWLELTQHQKRMYRAFLQVAFNFFSLSLSLSLLKEWVLIIRQCEFRFVRVHASETLSTKLNRLFRQ